MHPRTSQQLQELQPALSALEPLAHLQQRESRWTPAARRKLAIEEKSPEYVERKVKALLNKLTLENFDSVSNQILEWANKSKNKKNGATLILVIKLVFEKATDDAHWSEMYARIAITTVLQKPNRTNSPTVTNATPGRLDVAEGEVEGSQSGPYYTADGVDLIASPDRNGRVSPA
ncbi:hypothetical protein FS837_001570 [Tulasnella sp. UAMH 9824]|nr:hypothetical protein FS837_001570 [Tulasnella sp. UAMH 9824]